MVLLAHAVHFPISSSLLNQNLILVICFLYVTEWTAGEFICACSRCSSRENRFGSVAGNLIHHFESRKLRQEEGQHATENLKKCSTYLAINVFLILTKFEQSASLSLGEGKAGPRLWNHQVKLTHNVTPRYKPEMRNEWLTSLTVNYPHPHRPKDRKKQWTRVHRWWMCRG